ncbi:hypothetical protein CFF01_18780 [Shewanella marisflavi]|uniref:Uncharacterized protein n=1 Tax=Shewanella marisflavi TaxID=260364 RepID=A0AAC9XPX9_9GAMM|nr:hypothetical protein CFF01_18780 [Shewanella marisflavi]
MFQKDRDIFKCSRKDFFILKTHERPHSIRKIITGINVETKRPILWIGLSSKIRLEAIDLTDNRLSFPLNHVMEARKRLHS